MKRTASTASFSQGGLPLKRTNAVAHRRSYNYASRMLNSRIGIKRIGGEHHFKRSFSASFVLSGAAANPYYNITYVTLDSLPDYTNFTALFDQYKINFVKVQFHPPYVTGSGAQPLAATATTAFRPMIRLHSAVDLDDATPPTIVDTLRQYETYMVTDLTAPSMPPQGYVRKFRPHAAIAMYSGAFTSYGNVVGQWIDAASPGVQHYGLKYALENYSADGLAATQVVDISIPITVTVWLSCRSVF